MIHEDIMKSVREANPSWLVPGFKLFPDKVNPDYGRATSQLPTERHHSVVPRRAQEDQEDPQRRGTEPSKRKAPVSSDSSPPSSQTCPLLIGTFHTVSVLLSGIPTTGTLPDSPDQFTYNHDFNIDTLLDRTGTWGKTFLPSEIDLRYLDGSPVPDSNYFTTLELNCAGDLFQVVLRFHGLAGDIYLFSATSPRHTDTFHDGSKSAVITVS